MALYNFYVSSCSFIQIATRIKAGKKCGWCETTSNQQQCAHKNWHNNPYFYACKYQNFTAYIL